jgi:energy-coupling factor transporter ATP-binding protein EcfA2
MIDLHGATCQAAGRTAPVLNGVTVQIDSHELVLVVGANGSGKSTLARVIAGLMPLSAGTRSLRAHAHARVGLVLQDPVAQLVGATVEHDIAFGPECAGAPSDEITDVVDATLSRLGLTMVAARDPRELSGGEQQRVAIAGVLASQVDALVLDEPAAHLDAAGAAVVADVVKYVHASGIPVVLVSQRPDDIAHCTRVLALQAGRLVFDGNPRELLANEALVTQLGIGIPAATRLASRLSRRGIDFREVPVTIDELVTSVR